jgi:gag-polypeptide of LTR copia-type
MATKLIEAELKSTRVVPFSGKKEDWDMWQIKHMGRARVRGTYGILMGTEAVPVVAVGVSPTSDEEEIIELNTIAYNDLLQSVSEAISFNLVRTGITVELPDGSAAQAWKNLCSKYSPNTVAEKIRLKKELQQLKLESASDDPDVWLTKLELIRMQLIKFKAAVSDNDLIVHVLNNLPSDYNQLVVTMEYMLNKNELNINNMREMLNLAFSRMNPGGNVEEKALAAKHYTKQFKKNCRICGQQGHKNEDCWEKEENKHKRPANWKSRSPSGQTSSNNSSTTKKFEGKCNYCQKIGHKENECRKKIKEAANIAQEEEEQEEQHVMVANHALYAGFESFQDRKNQASKRC